MRRLRHCSNSGIVFPYERNRWGRFQLINRLIDWLWTLIDHYLLAAGSILAYPDFPAIFSWILISLGVQPARLESSTENEIFKIWAKSGELHFDCLLMQFPWHARCSRDNFMTLFVLLDYCALYGKIDLLRKLRKFSKILAQSQA